MDEIVFILLGLGVILGILVGSALGFVANARSRGLRREVEALSARLAALEGGAGRVASVAGAATAGEGGDAAVDRDDAGPVSADRREEPPPRPPAAADAPAPEEAREDLSAQAGAEQGGTEAAEPPRETVDASASASEQPAPGAGSPADARPGLEQAIGGRWAVWVGGLALALGGIFLVRYSIEAGLLGPAARVAGGFLFAAALLGAGEWLRRRDPAADAAPRGAYVPGVLTGAGTVAAFATTWAAYALYGFVGGPVAFAALGAVALATIALAVLHGPGLAALGLLASYLTPFLVSSQEPAFGPLAVYLLAVTAATLAVARIRFWRWLAASGVVGSVLWAMFMTGVASARPADGAIVAAFIAASAGLALLAFVASVHPADPGRATRRHDLTAVTLLGLFGLPVLLHVGVFETGSGGIALMVGFAAAAMVVAYEVPAVRLLVPVGIAVLLVGYTAIDVPFALELDPVTGIKVPPDLPSLLAGAPARRLVGAGAMLGLLFAALGLAGTLGSAARTQLAAAGATIPLGLLVLAYLRIENFEVSMPFGFAALALAAFLGITADRLDRRLTPGEWGVDGAVAAYAVTAVGALAAGLGMIFERGVLTLALAAIVPAIAYVEAGRPVPGLRHVALAVAAVVAVRFALDPEVVGPDLGTTPVFNWLLWGYGLPAVLFALAAHRFARTRDDGFVAAFEALAVVFATLTVTMVVHHAMAGGDVSAPVSGLAEQSLLAMSLMAVALGTQWLAVRRPASRVFSLATLVLGALGLAGAGWGLLAVHNPLFTGETIDGGAFDGTLLVGYLAPAMLALALARVASRRADRPTWYVAAAAALGGLLAIAWASLAVRAAWHVGDLRLDILGGGLEEGELYAYSAVWLAAGVALLAVGAVMGVRAVRVAAAALILAVVAKVFLVDTAGLTGALRAASFIGLGAVLVLVGLAYQRFQRRASPSGGGPAVSPPI